MVHPRCVVELDPLDPAERRIDGDGFVDRQQRRLPHEVGGG
jgi:hypothetical protein